MKNNLPVPVDARIRVKDRERLGRVGDAGQGSAVSNQDGLAQAVRDKDIGLDGRERSRSAGVRVSVESQDPGCGVNNGDRTTDAGEDSRDAIGSDGAKADLSETVDRRKTMSGSSATEEICKANRLKGTGGVGYRRERAAAADEHRRLSRNQVSREGHLTGVVDRDRRNADFSNRSRVVGDARK